MVFRLRVSGRKAVIPGFLYWNYGKKSMSWTVKVGPLSRTWSTSGRRTTTVSLQGPLSMRDVSTASARERRRAEKRADLQQRIDARRASIRARRDQE